MSDNPKHNRIREQIEDESSVVVSEGLAAEHMEAFLHHRKRPRVKDLTVLFLDDEPIGLRLMYFGLEMFWDSNTPEFHKAMKTLTEAEARSQLEEDLEIG